MINEIKYRSQHIKRINLINLLVWYICNSSWKCDIFATVMRYSYLINDNETIAANSFKKLLKKLSSQFKPNETVKISYINKKKHKLLKFIKVKKSD